MLSKYFNFYQYTFKDLFYNYKNNTGYLVTKQKNANTKKHKVEGTYGVAKKRKQAEVPEIQERYEKTLLIEEDLRFFQNCVVCKHLKQIKEKLENTLEISQSL